MQQFDLEDILIDKECSIKDAMKKLDTVASKILFVVEDMNTFIGSLTDGDIRRSILSNKSLDSSVLDACNKNSYSVSKNFDKETTIDEMKVKDLVFAPIVDDEYRIVNVFSVPESHKEVITYSKKLEDIPVVIMAGGKGSRLKPFTDVFPKPLVPVNEKPIMDWIIDGFQKFGINQFYATLNYRGKMIEAYYESIVKDYNLGFVWEKDFYGTAGSLSLVKDNISGTFIVSNCDIIVKADMADVIDFHKANNAKMTIVSSMQHIKVPYGVMEFGNGGIVKSIKEKPEYTFPINTGVYVLEKECLDYIPSETFFHITHLMESLIEKDELVLTYPVNESDYIDIGQWEEYHAAIENMKL